MISNCSQQSTTYPWSEASKFSLHFPILVLRKSEILILSFHIHLCLPSGLFLCRLFNQKSVHICLLSLRATSPPVLTSTISLPEWLRSESGIMKLLITKSSSSFYYFLLGPNTYLDRFVLETCFSPNRTYMRCLGWNTRIPQRNRLSPWKHKGQENNQRVCWNSWRWHYVLWRTASRPSGNVESCVNNCTSY